jgi:hypothetical protein
MARLGQIYRRREPADDVYDVLVVVGDAGSGEIALRVADGLEVIGADPAALAEHYLLAEDAPEPIKPELGRDTLATWSPA